MKRFLLCLVLFAAASPALAEERWTLCYSSDCEAEAERDRPNQQARAEAEAKLKAEQDALNAEQRDRTARIKAELQAQWQLGEQRSAEAQRLAEMKRKAMEARDANCRSGDPTRVCVTQE
jgi:hypothetical protein